MQQDFIYNNRKKIKIIGIVMVAAIILVSAFFIIWNALHSATVNITVAPSIARIYIGGREYKNIGEYKLIPGEYDVRVEADGFVTKTGELVAAANETVDILLYLEPTEDNASWYDEHPQDALIVGDVKSNLATEDLQLLMKQNPILKQLPIEIDYYTNNYSRRIKYTISYVLLDNNSRFKIIITDETGGNYEDALDKLRARGVSPEDYEIEYKDISSEFEWGHAGN